MKYQVQTFRDAGLEAKWSKDRAGRPFLAVRNPKAKAKHQRETWWMVSADMWATMLKEGVIEGFDQWTLLGDIFYI